MTKKVKFKDLKEEAATPSVSSAAATSRPSNDATVEEADMPASPMWENDDGWELTWPIWHMLPRDEKKTIAQRHGYGTIGAFEEDMALQRALDQTDSIQMPVGRHAKADDATTDAVISIVADNKKDDATSGDDSDSDDELNSSKRTASDDGSLESQEELTGEEAILLAGTIMVLHEELLHVVFSYLPVEMYGTLALVSPHWKYVTRTESVYKRLCERLYLNQSKRKQLHVSRFGNSYRKMLEIRPRVRTAGGCYILKYAQVKKIQRDMWTEIPVGAILETIYYRYMYFQEDGRVLYALTPSAPHVMMPRLLRVCLQRVRDPAAVWGTYQVQKNHLTVVASQDWTNVKFELTIQQFSSHGKFGVLKLDRHLTSASASFEDWSRDLVEYKVPVEEFSFISSSRL